MNNSCLAFKRKALVTALSLALPMVTSVSQAKDTEMQAQVDALQNQVTALNTEVQQAAEWKNPNTLMHMAGFADVKYVDPKDGTGSFTIGSFSPIFHYQYRDVVMLEAEIEMVVGEDGETTTDLGYMTIDWFLNDYMALVAGKFLSPIGQFRQNLHPSWVNKMVSAPPGFGHDGAAPISDMGLQLRGGFPVGGVRTNYAIYISNGPELKTEIEDDGTEFEVGLDGIAADGFGADRDGEKTWGGRYAILPMPSLEIGVSYATGQATVTEIENSEDPSRPAGEIGGQPLRDYDVVGADFVWFSGNMSLRGEYIKSEIGADNTAYNPTTPPTDPPTIEIDGATASGSAIWESYYVQAAYRVPNTKWEGVLRYGDFDSPHTSKDQTQTAVGVNYLVANNFIVKLTYEFNDGKVADTKADTDVLLTQLAYGF